MTIPNALIEEILKDVINLYLIPKHIDLGMKATGEWIESLEVQGNTIRGRKYTEQLVYGRSAGTMPPIAPLEKWVNAKFGIGGPQAKNIAWAVAKKIEKEGTSWKQKGGSDLLEVLESKQVIDYINERLGKYITAEATLELQRQLQTL